MNLFEDYDSVEIEVEELEQHGIAPLKQEQQMMEGDWESYHNMEGQEPSPIDEEISEYLGGC